MIRRLLILTFSFVSLSSIANANGLKATDVLNNLKTYDFKYFAEAKDGASRQSEQAPGVDAEEKELEKMDVVFDNLREGVRYLEKQKTWNPDLLSEIVRVANLCMSNDPTEYATELLYPLYKKDKDALLKEVKKLSKDEAAKLERSLKVTSQVMKKGNG